MLAEERREALLRMVERRGAIKVKEVAEEMEVSAVTLRQDVRDLAGRGLVVRVHGGAMSLAAAQGASTAGPAAPRPTVRQGHVFGLVVPPGDYYYPEIIRGVQDAARTHGVRIVLAVSGETLADNQEQVRRLVAAGADGLLLMPRAGLEPVERTEQWLAGLDIPVVLVDRRAGGQAGRLEQVASDHALGAGLAVRHLAELGHERIALVARAESPNTPLIREGYATACQALGLTAGPEYRIGPTDGPASTEWFEELARAVEAGDVGAALVHNDLDAVTLVGLLQARGLRVPEDLAIVTYDDEVAELSDVPLTAVAPPKRAVGAWAVDLMRRRLADPAAPLAELLLRPELRVRASSGSSAALSVPS
ncbi:substrate-binding domain-containing protein (plasmid) [Streptomyces sp. NBC_00841]|uniref:substrate-binding domain-containing protein n=1 Tax=unclassified Streptomyces TaxID=2593676 RepID=UPI002256A3A3|nr:MULTISPECIES: substrate-binding domain-containing protein [unclassified Streptomyces]MCX4538841.1 substrate-binding domain-containing protein [Streptomyces sp. NBC_01669]WSA05365.1 substrate-binding domain-containing protein [Streptomyces sp. NBC_00841]